MIFVPFRRREALPHQVKAIDYSLPRKKIALFMQMRLGKTLVAIRWCEDSCPSKVLVVCPNNVVRTWVSELALEGIHRVGDLTAPYSKWTALLDDPGLRYYVVNFERLRNSAIVDLPWDVVIVDESTRIRNPKSQITHTMLNGFRRTPRKAILTGCPDPEGLLDYVCQMFFLYGSFMGFNNYWEFRDEYFETTWTGWDWKPKYNATKEIMDCIKARSLFMTRKDAGLPDKKIREARYIKLPPKMLKAYRELESSWFLDGVGETKYAIVASQWLAKFTGGCCFPEYESPHKIHALEEVLEGELAKEPVVVWFRYNAEIDGVAKALAKDKISYAVIRGKGMDRDEREKNRLLFMRKKRRVLLAQARCAMNGVACHVADTMVAYSRYYDGEINFQMEERANHPQKKKPLFILDLVTEGTIDEEVYKAVQDKRTGSKLLKSSILASIRAKFKETHRVH